MSAKPTNDIEVAVPADLQKTLADAPAAEEAWHQLTSIGRRDFVSWIETAKLAETRQRRIERCRENLVAGKRRPCCYAVVPMDFYKALGGDPAAKAKWSELDANEKRDFSDWIEDSNGKEARKRRVIEACQRLVEGNRAP